MKTMDSASFRTRLSDKAKTLRFPLRVMLELTYDCNFNCPHCYIPNSHRAAYGKREMPARRIRSLITDLAKAGCLQLGLTGGEPLLKKGFFSILRHAKNCGLETYLYTNGSLITDSIARKLQKLGCDKVDITLPAFSKAQFGEVTSVPGARNSVFSAARLLKRRGLALGFKTCALKANKNELPRLKAFAKNMGGTWRLDTEHIPRLDGSPLPDELSHKRISPKKAGTSQPCRCGAGDSQCAITPAGELKPCVAVDSLKIRIGRSFPAAWKKLSRSKAKKNLARLCPAR